MPEDSPDVDKAGNTQLPNTFKNNNLTQIQLTLRPHGGHISLNLFTQFRRRSKLALFS
jgi:hypothetical protein